MKEADAKRINFHKKTIQDGPLGPGTLCDIKDVSVGLMNERIPLVPLPFPPLFRYNLKLYCQGNSRTANLQIVLSQDPSSPLGFGFGIEKKRGEKCIDPVLPYIDLEKASRLLSVGARMKSGGGGGG